MGNLHRLVGLFHGKTESKMDDWGILKEDSSIKGITGGRVDEFQSPCPMALGDSENINEEGTPHEARPFGDFGELVASREFRLKIFEFLWFIHHGLLDVPIEHHPTIRYMVYNGYYKVMSNSPKMGHLPIPVHGIFVPIGFLSDPKNDQNIFVAPRGGQKPYFRWFMSCFSAHLLVMSTPFKKSWLIENRGFSA